jgi:nucleoside-diphosphate-sugar epimerase
VETRHEQILFRVSNMCHFSGQRVLVTGASGFIGSHLCLRLQEHGGEVHAVSRSLHSADSSGIRWWKGNVCEVDTVRHLFSEINPEVIFHLASHVMGAPGLEHVLPTFHANLQSTVNMLTVAAERGCRRLILTSSLVEPEIGQVESFPRSPYAAAKCASSSYARMFHALYKSPIVIARVFMVYGPGQRDNTKLIPYVIRSILRGDPPEITSGKHLIDWIYVDDVVEGFIALGRGTGIEGQTFDIGSGSQITIRDIVQKVVDLMETNVEPIFGSLPDRPFEPLRVANVVESEKKLGWKPRVSLEEGLLNTIRWVRDQIKDPGIERFME